MTLPQGHSLSLFCNQKMMKKYKVKELAELTCVSVKTLHHYDKIGLLSPAVRSEKKYRLYGENELYRLQQILFYKELGVSLSAIAEILDDRNFDQVEALNKHKNNLLNEKLRIDELVLTIDKTILQLKGKTMISDKELYKGFNQEEIEKIKKESKKKFGEDNFKTSEKYLKSLSKDQFEILKLEQKEIFKNLLNLSSENIESETVQLEVARLYQNIRKFWGTHGSPSSQKSEFKGLGKLYVADKNYTKVDGELHEGFPEFLSEAMNHFAKTQL